MQKNFIPFVNAPFERVTAAGLNRRYQQIDDEIKGMEDGSADLDTPAITSFANSPHGHANAAGGGPVEVTSLKSTGASAGQVLTADGANGSNWATPGTFEAALRQGLSIRKLSEHEILIGAGSVVVEGVAINKATQTVLDKNVGAHWLGGASRELLGIYIHIYANSDGDLRLFDLAPNRTAPSAANLVCAMQVDQSGWDGTSGQGLNETSVVYDGISSGDEADIAAGMLLGSYVDSSHAEGRSGATLSRNYIKFARITAVNTGTNTLTLEAGHQCSMADNDYLAVLPDGMVLYRYEDGGWWRWLGAGKMGGVSTPEFVDDTAGEAHFDFLNSYGLADYTTTSTTWVAIHDTYHTLSLFTQGGDVEIHFHGEMNHSAAGGAIWLSASVDGNTPASDNANSYLVFTNPDAATVSQPVNLAFTRLFTGLLPGYHTFQFLWRTNAATGKFLLDVYVPQIWAKEVPSRGGQY